MNNYLKNSLSAVALFLTFLVSSAQAEPYNASERFSGEYKTDYAFHYGAGFVIGAGTSYVLEKKYPDMKPWVNTAISIAIPMVIKGAMEIFDENPSFWDVAEYGVGATAGRGVMFMYTWYF